MSALMARRKKKAKVRSAAVEGHLARCALSPDQLEDLHATLSARVKEVRLELGLSQEQLGRALGRTQTWVTEVEKGRTVPAHDVLVALALASRRSVGWFYGEPGAV